MPRPDWKRYLDNFGIREDHPIWKHWEEEARMAGYLSSTGEVGNGEIKKYVLDMLFDRDRRLWNGKQIPVIGPSDLWFPSSTALVDLASLEALQSLLASTAAAPVAPVSTLTIDEEAATSNAAAFAEAWDD